MTQRKTYQGFRLGGTYTLKVAVKDEKGEAAAAGTQLRIVAIAPSVCRRGVYFYNAVRTEHADFYEECCGQNPDRKPVGSRIRENFDTLNK